MKPDNLIAGAAGAGAVAAAFGASTRTFEQNVSAMNRQIETDLYTLGQTGHLPDVQPVLPFGRQQRSIPGLLLSSLLIGGLISGGITFVFTLVGGLTMGTATPMAVLLGAVTFGIGAAILTGWLPGTVVYLVRQTRETARRTSWAVFEKYGAYWHERGQAQAALREGRVDPHAAALRLSAHHLDHLVED